MTAPNTKEEIINEYCTDFVSDGWDSGISIKSVEVAMDEYAKQQAIDLLNWMGKNNYELVGWDHITEMPLWANANGHNSSAETLFEQYEFEKLSP